MSMHIQKICGGKPTWYVQQPYFLKHSPMNPAFGSVHDGTSTDFGKGFMVRKIHWLYRFRFNTAPLGSVPLNLVNPGGKFKHWLEITSYKKFYAQCITYDARPHMLFVGIVVAYTLWQSYRYWVWHPDISMYILTMGPLKHFVTFGRWDDYHPMDKPTFRYFQRGTEFYGYDPYRAMIQNGWLANDPFVARMEALGKHEDLIAYPSDLYHGHVGKYSKAKLVPDLLPRQYRWSHGMYAKDQPGGGDPYCVKLYHEEAYDPPARANLRKLGGHYSKYQGAFNKHHD